MFELSVVNPVGTFGPVLSADYASSVADLVIHAMVNPAAAGEQFLARSGQVMTTEQIALLLRDRLRKASNAKAIRVLDWSPRPVEATVVATRKA